MIVLLYALGCGKSGGEIFAAKEVLILFPPGRIIILQDNAIIPIAFNMANFLLNWLKKKKEKVYLYKCGWNWYKSAVLWLANKWMINRHHARTNICKISVGGRCFVSLCWQQCLDVTCSVVVSSNHGVWKWLWKTMGFVCTSVSWAGICMLRNISIYKHHACSEK